MTYKLKPPHRELGYFRAAQRRKLLESIYSTLAGAAIRAVMRKTLYRHSTCYLPGKWHTRHRRDVGGDYLILYRR